jgi:tetratricopeptide (TPR) repeat protein
VEELNEQSGVLSNSELTSLASIVRASQESSPNLAYVIAYWQAVRQVEPEQIRAQAENVLADITRRAASPILADERAIELMTSLVASLDLESDDLDRLFSKDSESLVGLANVYINNQDYLSAIRVLSDAIEKSVSSPPQQAPAYAGRGLAHGMLALQRKAKNEDFQEDYDCADMDFAAAKEKDPDYSGTYNNEGAVWIARQDFQKAVTALDLAIELNPSLAKAFLNRGKAHSNLKHNDLAIADFTRAIELARAGGLESVLRDAYYERATLFLNNQDGEKAERDFGETLYQDPLNAAAYLGRGQALLLGKGKSSHTRAIYYFETAIDLYDHKEKLERRPSAGPEKAMAYSYMGQAYLLLDQPIDALSNIDLAMSGGDSRPLNYKMRGLANISIGNTAQAIKDLNVYVNLLPDEAPDRASAMALVKQLEDKLKPAPQA